MDLHDRYLHFSTLDIAALQTANDKVENVFVMLHRLIQVYNRELIKESLDMSKLEICRMLLCHEYQLLFNATDKKDDKRCIIPENAEKICFPSIETIFPVQHLRSTSEILVLRDIFILQMVLHCNTESIKRRLQDFLSSSNIYTTNSETRVIYMKILEYFLESLHLHQSLHNDTISNSDQELENLGSTYVKAIKSWMEVKEDAEWRLFASMLPILMKTFSPQCVLFPLWHYILSEMSDLKERERERERESLTVLSIMADACFISLQSVDLAYIHCEIYSNATFWLLILKGLRSPLQQCRKQALYIMKKAISSMDEVRTENLRSSKALITPFICNKSDDTDLPIKQKFFLVYEALEEKQYHLVAPALTHVPSLVKANREHKSCNECFNIVWLQCVFEKILQHENHNIARWGLYQICKLDDNMFDDEFLELFVGVLNNTFVYDGVYPQILTELSTFFKRTAEGNLLNKFFNKLSRVNWGPVAIYYIMHALRTFPMPYSEKIQYASIWQANELSTVKSLVETNLSMHSFILRVSSQIELLKAIPKFVQKIDNLMLLANTLGTFPTNESLIRGTTLWNETTTWLQKTLAKTNAIAFVRDVCAKYLTCEDACHEISPRTFALMIYLLYDANIIFLYKACPARKALNNWLCILNDIDMRPYADMRSSIDAVEFISHLMDLYGIEHREELFEETSNSLMYLISTHVYVSFKFLIKHMRKMTANLTYENYTRLREIVSTHMAKAKLFMPQKHVDSYAEKLQSESIRLLENIQQRQSMQYLYGLHVLQLSQNEVISETARNFSAKCLLNVQANLTNISNDIDATNLKGKITSEYYLLLSKLMDQYLMNSPVHLWLPECTIATFLDNLLQFLELGGPEIVCKIADILARIINNKVIINVNDRETFKEIFKLCWRCIFANKKNNIFWMTIQGLMEVIINDNFFLWPYAVEFTTEYIDQLMEEGDNTPRFKRIILSSMDKLNEFTLIQFTKQLLNCLLHGPPLRRDKRIEDRTHLFIDVYLKEYCPANILELNFNCDAAIRAHATVLLHRIVSHTELNYAANIMPLIFEMFERYKNKRYFNNSYLHKLKHRLMQILLILKPVLDEGSVVLLQEKLCDLIFLESNQHSVRLMQEWLLIQIFRKNINLHDKLWEFFAKSIRERPGCTISVASIVYHVARLLSSNSQKVFIRAALPYIAQCCLGQQYNMRLYNQFILVQLYELMSEVDGNNIILEYNGIYQAAVASLQQESSTKNSIRIQDDFYFSSFHAIKDYTLEIIFKELPRLTNVSSDEWIIRSLFNIFGFRQNDNHPLENNNDSFLSETTVSMYLTKSLPDDTDSLANNVETYLEGLHDVQKKIDPSKTTVSLYNEIFEEMKRSICQQDSQLYEKNLIVVASFVTRPPNLGGIARTCEVFGVKALVLANLDCTKDKEFQCLSVSAEKWINIIQVKPHELQKYLLEKKNAGWSLIGAEQTANSINLLETRFKEKTILVLGNEKDGIPANFIPLFDTCVEIPQLGVIRSLNVHVTAAICIWQFASQHMLK